MKIINLYDVFHNAFEKLGKKNIEQALQSHPSLAELHAFAIEWEHELENVERWLISPEYKTQKETAKHFSQAAHSLVRQIEKVFGVELPGELRLSPSLMRFDGFARYDSGSHNVWFGID